MLFLWFKFFFKNYQQKYHWLVLEHMMQSWAKCNGIIALQVNRWSEEWFTWKEQMFLLLEVHPCGKQAPFGSFMCQHNQI